MSKDVQVHVGATEQEFGARFADAFHRAARGTLTMENAEIHASFADWETMVRVLSPKRMALLRHVHQTPAKNISALATALGRDYRRVHEDVEALAGAGLLERDKQGLRADYRAFNVQMTVAL